MTFPPRIEPMKAHVAPDYELDKYENSGWCAQEKLDGTHIVVIKNGGVAMMSRSWKNDFAPMYPEIAAEVSSLPEGTILDAELVFYRKDNGKPEFVTALATPETKEKYYVKLMLFDVLQLGQVSTRPHLTLEERFNLMKDILNPAWKHIAPIPTVFGGFNDFYKRTVANGGEGIMLKKLDSKYVEGTRSSKWLKCKREASTDCFVLGIDRGEGKYSDLFGALVIGQIVDGKPKVVGKVSGMTDDLRKQLFDTLMAMPNAIYPHKIKDVIKQVDPSIVIEVKIMEVLPSGNFRHPRFLRIRDDKMWYDCTEDSNKCLQLVGITPTNRNPKYPLL